jgi:two-component system, chemotaxis family, chemotaxis protein CheY
VKALIVEDSQIMRKIVKTNLLKLSVNKVYEASDGESALAVVSENPDLSIIFTDLNMPNMNGIEFCKKIKQQSKLANIKIIVISEYLNETAKESFLNMGISSFVPKPFDLVSFNEVVIPIVEGAKSGRLPKSGVDFAKDDFVKKIKEEEPLVSLDTEELTISFNKLSIKVSLDKILEVGKIKNDEEKGDYVELKDK